MHRLVASDDRYAMGSSMNMVDEQFFDAGALGTGEAIIFSEADDKPMVVRFDRFIHGDLKFSRKQDQEDYIHQKMARIPDRETNLVYSFRTCRQFCDKPCGMRNDAKLLLENRIARDEFKKIIFSFLIDESPDREYFIGKINNIVKKYSSVGFNNDLVNCVCVQIMERYFDEVQWFYHNSYESISGVKNLFARFVKGDKEITAARLRQEYRKLYKLDYFPFYCCKSICPDCHCIYRGRLKESVADSNLHRVFYDAGTKRQGEAKWAELAKVALRAGQTILTRDSNRQHQINAALCFALQKSIQMENMTDEIELKLVTGILQYFKGT